MGRGTEPRQPAAPVSGRQVARRIRILRAASELAARDGLAGIQMQDVAKEASVALGTLYRYFPSKPYLFAAVFEWHIETILEGHGADTVVDATADRAAEVADTLIALSVKLLDSPLLASATALSAFSEYAAVTPTRFEIVESCLGQTLLRVLGVDEVREQDRSVVRLLIYSWWGLFVAMLTEELTARQAESDLRLAARLILAPYDQG
ncbi:TetR/AcrR family transcriptional regulator [Streptomyces fulvoviolaceus]|uniref:TetR/AcrR family transcriptional regulator n=1 Tax=Streptomyces fulvoviolaceus TaxID=285535 RepID=UPI0004C702A2|nr:TetR/AcrR family transcriptional regulator [Streptomyces fulvoviolaceus]MCT9077471.1 TetR family transcriptional regulator [Streptomyces fulvoviolaceus]